MQISDYVAIGIVLFFVILGLLGSFKWIVQLLSGLLIGLIVLCCIVYLTENPRFDAVSQGLFERGMIFPYLKSQMKSVQDYIDKNKLVSKVDAPSQSFVESKYALNVSNDKDRQP
jgi:hypothetical protein